MVKIPIQTGMVEKGSFGDAVKSIYLSIHLLIQKVLKQQQIPKNILKGHDQKR